MVKDSDTAKLKQELKEANKRIEELENLLALKTSEERPKTIIYNKQDQWNYSYYKSGK